MGVEASLDHIPSHGSIKVPVIAEGPNAPKDFEAIRSINQFKISEVEKAVLDASVDVPSQARLLGEFKCFGNWQRQHDLYRKVLRESSCAYLRHRAVQLLEFDLCNPETVGLLADEFRRSNYPPTRELILRKLALSRDKRALDLLMSALKSENKSIAKAAAEAKSIGEAQQCSPQVGAAKPYYGSADLAEACDSIASQPQAAEDPNAKKSSVTLTPPGAWNKPNTGPSGVSGMVESVDFGGNKK